MPERRTLLLGVAALAVAGCGGGGNGDGATGATGTTASGAGTACTAVAAPAARDVAPAKRPAGRLDPAVTYTLTFRTNCGDFTLTLDQAAAPDTAASLVSLARTGFFDDTVFHRIVPGFVIQGGDPTQTGTGGPGYSTRDAPPSDAAYVKGVVAMAKTQAEPPGTAGSQFFVVTAADAGLPPDFSIVGRVTSGLDVVERIGRLGDPATEQPTEPVVIRTVEVGERE